MATFDTFVPARSAPSMGLFSNVLGNIVAWNDRRVTIKMLSALTDRELEDIGLQRAEIYTWSAR